MNKENKFKIFNADLINQPNIYGVIYKLICIVNNKIYIGQSKNPLKRFDKHIRDSFCKTSKGYENPIHRAIRKYGVNNFNVEIIDTAFSKNDLNNKERFYIKKFNSYDSNIGYNLTLGGEGGDLLSFKSEADYKIAKENYRLAAIKRENRPEIKKLRSETTKRLRATTSPIWNKGVNSKQESIDKWKETMRKKKECGWKYSRDSDKFRNSTGKHVICIDNMTEYSCAKQACEDLGLDIRREREIRYYCNGKRHKKPFNLDWRWA